MKAEAGPAVPARSAAPPAAKRGITVPSEQLVTVSVRVAPESAPGAKTQPVAVPVLVKSAAATPVTDSENVSVYVSVVAFVGEAVTAANDATVGAVTSRVIVVVALATAAGPVLAAASAAPPALNCGVTVPSEQPVIVTVRDAPVSLPGANTQSVAVPEFAKSPAATSVTASENVSV